MSMEHYERKVFYHKPDKCWIAIAPQLQGCSAGGETPDEALAELEIAMVGWLKVAKKYRHRTPEPIADKELNGRILLRLPKSLHRELLEEATEEGVSLNQYVLLVLAGRRRSPEAPRSGKSAYASIQGFPAIFADRPAKRAR